MKQIFNGKGLQIDNFWSLGTDAPTYYVSQKYCFTIINRVTKGWGFIITGLWVLTHPPINSVKNISCKAP